MLAWMCILLFIYVRGRWGLEWEVGREWFECLNVGFFFEWKAICWGVSAGQGYVCGCQEAEKEGTPLVTAYIDEIVLSCDMSDFCFVNTASTYASTKGPVSYDTVVSRIQPLDKHVMYNAFSILMRRP